MKNAILLSGLLSVMSLFPVHAMTGHEGGGGDASELRVNEIRSDLLNWIKDDGAKKLELPSTISYGEYVLAMNDILQPKKVIIGFIEKDDRNDDELKVSVDGKPKTCRGFYSRRDSKPHIICNISRFKNTSESDQYKLIHHEYAGLVNIENNEGAASDYSISSQLTNFLQLTTILKLSVKKQTMADVDMFTKLSTLFKVGSAPDLSKISNLAWSGRCYSEGNTNTAINGVYIIRPSINDNGPLGPQAYEAATYFNDKFNANKFDHKSVRKITSFKGINFNSASEVQNEITTDMGSLTSHLRTSGKYLINEFTHWEYVLYRCYYFIPTK